MYNIIQYLKKQLLRSWQIIYIQEQINEIHAIDQQIETRCCSYSGRYLVSVHTNKPQKNLLGESIAKFDTTLDWRSIIQEHIAYSTLVNNPIYNFSPPWELIIDTNPICDPSIKNSVQESLLELANQLNSLTKQSMMNCSLASYEISLKNYYTTLVNANNLKISIPSTQISVDFVLLSPDKQEEINHYDTRRFIQHYDIVDLIIREAQHLSLHKISSLPPTKIMHVVFTDEALDNLFDYFVAQTDGNALYYKYASLHKEASIYEYSEEIPTNFNLASDPFIKGGGASQLFDQYGFPTKKVELIQNSKLKNYCIDGKLSQLLDKKHTSSMGNICIQPGSRSYQDFLDNGEEVLEIFKFSSFNPNNITGAFSGEIRLAYLYKNKNKTRIKGGAISGTSRKNFINAHFSRETIQRGSYLGPKGILFEKMQVAGSVG